MKNILVIGATSAIANATARLYAKRGDRLYLMGRDTERLQSISQDLLIRGASEVFFYAFDFNEFNKHKEYLDNAISSLRHIDIVLIAHGSFPDQQACQDDFTLALAVLNDNAISTISMLTYLAGYFEKRGSGTIAVISSVAGDRGRKSNYVYGAAKASVSTFLQGLRNRLHPFGVHVLTIKPGYVDTPMTVNYKKGLLWAKPESVARGIVTAIRKRHDIVYVPYFWKVIMLIIKLTPEFIFKRTSL